MDSSKKTRLKSVEILLPGEACQKQFDEFIHPVLRQVAVLRNQNQNFQQTRDLLLTRLISGKLSVENLDISFPASMTPAEAPAQSQ